MDYIALCVVRFLGIYMRLPVLGMKFNESGLLYFPWNFNGNYIYKLRTMVNKSESDLVTLEKNFMLTIESIKGLLLKKDIIPEACLSCCSEHFYKILLLYKNNKKMYMLFRLQKMPFI